MVSTLLIILLMILIFTSGFFSASETSFFSLSSMKVRAYKHGEDKRGHIITHLLANPQKLLVLILMLNVLMNILIQNVVSSIFGSFSSWFVNVGVPLLLTLIFGEVIPKSVALANNAKISYSVAPFFQRLEKVLGPIRNVITWLTLKLFRIFFFFLNKESAISVDELKHALRTSKDFGVLGEEEVKLMRGYLNLEEDLIKEMMCPRQEVLYYDIHEPVDRLMHLFVDEECTRIPVCDGSLEKVLGVITSGGFFLHRDRINSPMDILPFLKKPIFIPESKQGKQLLRELYQKEETMMFVVDEYGSVSGLITLEDLVEVVIGQIADRRDEKPLYTQSGPGVIIASGKMELATIEEIFDIHLETSNNMVTIGGWLTEQLGDIPKSGVKHVTKDFLFHILASDVNRVRRVYIRRLNPHPSKRKKEDKRD